MEARRLHHGLFGKEPQFLPTSQLFDESSSWTTTAPPTSAGTRTPWPRAIRAPDPPPPGPAATGINPFARCVQGTYLVAEQTIGLWRNIANDQFAAWVSFPDPHTPFQVCIPSIHVSADRSRSASARRELEIKPERHRAFHRLVRMDEQTETDIER